MISPKRQLKNEEKLRNIIKGLLRKISELKNTKAIKYRNLFHITLVAFAVGIGILWAAYLYLYWILLDLINLFSQQ